MRTFIPVFLLIGIHLGGVDSMEDENYIVWFTIALLIITFIDIWFTLVLLHFEILLNFDAFVGLMFFLG